MTKSPDYRPYAAAFFLRGAADDVAREAHERGINPEVVLVVALKQLAFRFVMMVVLATTALLVSNVADTHGASMDFLHRTTAIVAGTCFVASLFFAFLTLFAFMRAFVSFLACR